MKTDLSGSWSATPTPFTKNLQIDIPSVKRMIEHTIGLRQKGIFIGGTCGEGPYMTRDMCRELITKTCQYNGGKLAVAVQVTDNSHSRVLANIKDAKAEGADVAVVAEPWFGLGLMKHTINEHFHRIADNSTMPVAIYCRQNILTKSQYLKLFMHPNVHMVKDSSFNEEIMQAAIEAMAMRADLAVLNGLELGPDSMPKYLKAGYRGVVIGGGILVGHISSEMCEVAKKGDFDRVFKLQKKVDRILYCVYGGKKIRCWLTGLKYALVKMKIFKSTEGYLKFPLPEAMQKKIDTLIKKERSLLNA